VPQAWRLTVLSRPPAVFKWGRFAANGEGQKDEGKEKGKRARKEMGESTLCSSQSKAEHTEWHSATSIFPELNSGRYI